MNKIILNKKFLEWNNKNFKRREKNNPSDRDMIVFLINKAFRNNVKIGNEIFYRGQVMTSHDELVNEFKIDRSAIRRFLNRYTEKGLWGKTATSRYTLLTLNNFEKK